MIRNTSIKRIYNYLRNINPYHHQQQLNNNKKLYEEIQTSNSSSFTSFTSPTTLFQSKMYYSEYWERKLPTIEKEASEIIEMVLNFKDNKVDIIRLQKKLNDYLELSPYCLFSEKRTFEGITALVVAIGEEQIDQLEERKIRIADIVCKSENFKTEDYKVVKHCIEAIMKRTETNIEKNKKNYFYVKINQFIQDNKHLINEKMICFTFSIMLKIHQTNKNTIFLFRYRNSFDLMQHSLKPYLKAFLKNEHPTEWKRTMYRKYFSMYFLKEYLFLVRKLGFADQESAELYYEYYLELFNSKIDPLKFSINTILFNLIYLPYVRLNGGVDNLVNGENNLVNGENNHPKNTTTTIFYKFLEIFKELYKEQGKEKYLQNSDIKRTGFLFNYMFEETHQAYLKLPFRRKKYENDEDNDILFLSYKDVIHIKDKIFGEFFWEMFKLDEETILKKGEKGVAGFFKVHYPEKITMRHIKVLNNINNVSTTIENEAPIRVRLSLKKLNIEYKTEAIIQDRTVDILLEKEKIIIEIDGENHFDFRTMETTKKTSFRNLLFMFSGYKVMVISTYEYLSHRYPEEMSKLIERKLKILSEDDNCFVQ